MFGNIVANYEDLNDQEKVRYQELYCGLCHTIKQRYGQLSRTTLSYDLTFFVVLLNSLYEPMEKQTSGVCILSKGEAKGYSQSIYSDYAADITIMLAYHKCLDDWHDEGKLTSRSFGYLLKKHYREACNKRPEQSRVIEKALKEIAEIEKSTEASLDAAANCFGNLMGELFAYQKDNWTEMLREFGVQLGRFIYVMDAAIDYEDDQKSGNYNPFVAHDISSNDIKIMLTVLIGDTTKAFEKLPLEQDLHLLRSVLYAGVWQQYYYAHKSRYSNAETTDSATSPLAFDQQVTSAAKENHANTNPSSISFARHELFAQQKSTEKKEAR